MLVKCKIESLEESSNDWIKTNLQNCLHLRSYYDGLQLGEYYVVHAIQYSYIPFVYVYTESFWDVPDPFPLEFFEVVDPRLSKHFRLGTIKDSPIRMGLDSIISFKEWADNPDFYEDLYYKHKYTKVTKSYRKKLGLEFFNPNLNISGESAIILDPKMSWLFCPACTESWEVKTDDEMTACPSCRLYYFNPFIKMLGRD